MIQYDLGWENFNFWFWLNYSFMVQDYINLTEYSIFSFSIPLLVQRGWYVWDSVASEILQLLQERTLPVRQQLQLHRVRGQTQRDPQPYVDKQRGLSVEPDRSTTATAAVANLHTMSCNHHGVTVCETEDAKWSSVKQAVNITGPHKRSLSVFFIHLSIGALICCTVHAWSQHLCLQLSVKWIFFPLPSEQDGWYCIWEQGRIDSHNIHSVMIINGTSKIPVCFRLAFNSITCCFRNGQFSKTLA